MKTTLAMVLILVVMTSITVYLDRYYLAQHSSINDANLATDLEVIRDDEFNEISPSVEEAEELNHSIPSRDFKQDEPQPIHDQRKVRIDRDQLSRLETSDWITLPLTNGSITLKVKSKGQRSGQQTLILSDVDSGLNSVITITDKAVFGTLTTGNGNHQLTAFNSTQTSLDQSNVYSGSVQEELPEHKLFSQLRESDELFPNAEDLLNETEQLIHKEHFHHHEHFHTIHEH